MSRRIISLFISIMLLFTCLLPFNMIVSATDENLIFELDLSEATASNVVIKDSVAGLIGTDGGDAGVLPAFAEEDGIKYLSFRKDSTDTTTGKERVVVFENQAFSQQKAMTFEIWMRPRSFGANDASLSGRLFQLSTNAAGSDSHSTADVFCFNGITRWRPNKNGNVDYEYEYYGDRKVPFQAVNGTWTHFVYTRKWTPESDGSETGNWEGDLYIDGVKITRPTGSAATRGNPSTFYEDVDKFLAIGNKPNGTGAFYGDISRFKVYNTVLSDETVASKYTAEKNQFIAYADTLEIESISASGNTISDAAGEISVTFNNYIDINTIKAGISFTKTDGGEVTGGANITAKSDFSNEVVIRYGKLDTNAEYQLNITSDLKSVNNKPFSGNGTYTYTAVREYIFFEDFMGEEYIVGENPPSNGAIEYTSFNETGNASNITVRGDDSFKYLSMTGGGEVTKNSRIKLVFDTPVTENVFAADVKIRPSSTDNAPNNDTPRNVMTVAGSGGSVQLADMRYGYVKANTAPGSGATLSGDVAFSQTDSNGFYDLNAIFEKNSSGNYRITIRNANATSEGKAVYTTKSVQDVKSIEISHLYPLNATQATSVSADVAQIAIYKTTAPEILYTNFEEIAREDDEIKITFNDDMDESYIDESTFTLIAPDGNNVYAEYNGYDDETRTATLVLKDYLDSSVKYTLRVTDIASESGLTMSGGEYEFTSKAAVVEAEDVKAYDHNNSEITDLDGAESFKGTVTISNNSTDEVVCSVVLVLYDADGRIIDMIKNSEDGTIDGGESKEISAVADDITDVENIKILAWADKDNGAVPVMKPAVLAKVN